MPLNREGHFVLSRAYSSGDIRGKVGLEVQTEDALRLGRATGFALEQRGEPKRVVVGGDFRLSTRELKAALVEGLLGSGCRVYDLGNVPTPAFYLAKEKLQAPAGVMVTASHNPPDENGFKPIIGELPNTEQELRELWGFVEQGRSGRGKGEVERLEILEGVAFTERLGYEVLAGLRAWCRSTLSASRARRICTRRNISASGRHAGSGAISNETLYRSVAGGLQHEGIHLHRLLIDGGKAAQVRAFGQLDAVTPGDAEPARSPTPLAGEGEAQVQDGIPGG